MAKEERFIHRLFFQTWWLSAYFSLLAARSFRSDWKSSTPEKADNKRLLPRGLVTDLPC